MLLKIDGEHCTAQNDSLVSDCFVEDGSLGAYFGYRTPDNDTVFARCSTTGDITTLWPGPIQPLGVAVDDASLYVTTSERADDGLRGLGALLALPAAG